MQLLVILLIGSFALSCVLSAHKMNTLRSAQAASRPLLVGLVCGQCQSVCDLSCANRSSGTSVAQHCRFPSTNFHTYSFAIKDTIFVFLANDSDSNNISSLIITFPPLLHLCTTVYQGPLPYHNSLRFWTPCSSSCSWRYTHNIYRSSNQFSKVSLVNISTLLRPISTVDCTYTRTTKVVLVVFSMQNISHCGC